TARPRWSAQRSSSDERRRAGHDITSNVRAPRDRRRGGLLHGTSTDAADSERSREPRPTRIARGAPRGCAAGSLRLVRHALVPDHDVGGECPALGFDQGLRMVYAFNHAEALKAFRQAVRVDPSCAMCYWGIALAEGSNYNSPTDSDREKSALAAI